MNAVELRTGAFWVTLAHADDESEEGRTMSMSDRDGVESFDPGAETVDEQSELTATLGPGDLDPDEERLLAALERDVLALRPIPVEDTIPPLPARAQPGPPDDGLTPRFSAPGDD